MREGTSMKADLVFIKGKVITVDRNFSIQEAVAIKSGRIIAVGANREIDSHVGAETKIIDLAGKALLLESMSPTCMRHFSGLPGLRWHWI